MRIALDYDGTYTEDPELWLQFVKNAKDRGHTVYLVTMRNPAEVNDDDPAKACDPRIRYAVDMIVATCRLAKRPFCERLGIGIDVWIDDRPEFILHSAAG